jgi:8-oxo-dGTP diphosphatase
MKVRPSVAIINNDKVLLMRYHYGNTDVFNLPGGNVDAGETLAQTVVRELLEELGIDIEVEQMLLTGEVILPEQKNDVLHCVFRATISNGEPLLNPKETSALALVWQPIDALGEIEMYPNVGKELQNLIETNAAGAYLGKINQQWHQ